MVSSTFPVLRFYFVRMMRTQPFALGALVLCLTLASVAAVAWTMQSRRLAVAESELAGLVRPAPAMPNHAQEKNAAPAELPTFESARLVEALNDNATESELTLDEVSYALEDNASLPYLRYRVTLTVNASYPLVRRLAERLSATMPHLTIDAIKCARKEVLVAQLSCDLAISGFFRKEARHG